MRCTAYKVAPDDGRIQSETCRVSNGKSSPNHKNSVHLVALYTHVALVVMFNFNEQFCLQFCISKVELLTMCHCQN